MQVSKLARLSTCRKGIRFLPIVLAMLLPTIVNSPNISEPHPFADPVAELVVFSLLDAPKKNVTVLDESGEVVNRIHPEQNGLCSNGLLYKTAAAEDHRFSGHSLCTANTSRADPDIGVEEDMTLGIASFDSTDGLQRRGQQWRYMAATNAFPAEAKKTMGELCDATSGVQYFYDCAFCDLEKRTNWSLEVAGRKGDFYFADPLWNVR